MHDINVIGKFIIKSSDTNDVREITLEEKQFSVTDLNLDQIMAIAISEMNDILIKSLPDDIKMWVPDEVPIVARIYKNYNKTVRNDNIKGKYSFYITYIHDSKTYNRIFNNDNSEKRPNIKKIIKNIKLIYAKCYMTCDAIMRFDM